MSEEEMLQIEGMTPQALATLRENGIRTIEVLAMQKKDTLIDIGISESTAEKILEGAWKKLGYTFKTANTVLEEESKREILTTGSERLDNLLKIEGMEKGGIMVRTLTEFAGAFGSGKTTALLTIVATNLGQTEDITALWIDTESSFSAVRLREIAEARGYDADNILKRVIYAEAVNSEHLSFLLDKADALLKTRKVKILAIDSLPAHFRSEYVGREMLAQRQQRLGKTLRDLLGLAKAYNLAVVFTNQVVANPSGVYTIDPVTLEQPVGGHILGHTSTVRIYLRKTSDPTVRIARTFDVPWIPQRETPIKITKKGIE